MFGFCWTKFLAGCKVGTVRYWLTTHYPPLKKDEPKTEKTGVWVRDGKQDVLGEMQPGDLVFIYESKSGKAVIVKTADGRIETVPRIQGRGGIIKLAEIKSKATDRGKEGYKYYADGTKTWWRSKADADVINRNGFVERRSLTKILGVSENYVFHGFGDKQSGVKQLSKTEFESIRNAFLASEGENEVVRRSDRRVRDGGGGEGPLHKSLKDYIAAEPAEALNEEGLRTVKREFDEFPTGDRIDVLLKDENGRYVTVEVEIDCNDNEVAGPLQCMKYRALIAYWYRRSEAEVRTVLAARSIMPSVKKQCEDYGIQVVEIPQWPIKSTP
jgi:hypothetical protein